MKGIYQYKDLKTGLIVYVGKDSHIDKNTRHKNHFSPSYYDKQVINRVLQNNPDRYEYSVLYSSDDVLDDDLNMLEMSFIEGYNPKFNFTNGGEGLSGYKHTEKTKRKISESNKGKIKSDEHKQKISKALRRKDLDDDIFVKEYFDNGLTLKEIAEKYNCNPQTVSNRIKSQGYQLRDKDYYRGK